MAGTDLKIAYMLMVHRSPEQVNMLLGQLLSDEQADVYVHIDRKSREKMAGEILADPRVTVLEESISVVWGDISYADAVILLLRAIVRSGKGYDYVCFISGQELMVRSGFKEFLAEHRGQSFFDIFEVDIKSDAGAHFMVKYPKCMRKLFDSLHPYRIMRMVIRKLYGLGINLFPNRAEFFRGMRLYAGILFFCETYDLAKYMVAYMEENPWYYDAFRDLYLPDTILFNTLAMNSPFAGNIVNQPFGYQRITYDGPTKHEHPKIFTSEDIREIEDSGCYFARKFDLRADRGVMEYFIKKVQGP